jgi:hydroxyacylglutathione hydrolase
VLFQDLALVVHTHAHFDHCGTTAFLLQQQPNLPNIMHAADAPFAQNGENQMIRPNGLLGYLAKPFLNRRFAGFTPSIVVNNPISLEAFGLDAMLIPTAGHTEGSLSLIFKNGDAVVGDLLAGNVFQPQKVDYHVFIDDKNQNNASIRRVIELGGQRFFVGHGGPFTLNEVFKRLDKKCFL